MTSGAVPTAQASGLRWLFMIAWFLDAIATATLIFIGAKILAAIGRSEINVRLTPEPDAKSRGQDGRIAA